MKICLAGTAGGRDIEIEVADTLAEPIAFQAAKVRHDEASARLSEYETAKRAAEQEMWDVAPEKFMGFAFYTEGGASIVFPNGKDVDIASGGYSHANESLRTTVFRAAYAWGKLNGIVK